MASTSCLLQYRLSLALCKRTQAGARQATLLVDGVSHARSRVPYCLRPSPRFAGSHCQCFQWKTGAPSHVFAFLSSRVQVSCVNVSSSAISHKTALDSWPPSSQPQAGFKVKTCRYQLHHCRTVGVKSNLCVGDRDRLLQPDGNSDAGARRCGLWSSSSPMLSWSASTTRQPTAALDDTVSMAAESCHQAATRPHAARFSCIKNAF